MISQLREKARELLVTKQVECFIGYEQGTDGLNARPFFAYEPAETERLIFDPTCVHNLTRYLLDRRDRPNGILVKPCDSRAINMLLHEKQLNREKLYIIGVACDGVVEVSWGKPSSSLQSQCLYCPQTAPVVYDLLLGEPSPKKEVAQEEGTPTPEARRAFWQEQFSRCIRCYACRQVCPGCYCPQCFADILDPLWVGNRIDLPRNQTWNLGRAMHLAGRCIDCGECERVCPMNIPLMQLNQRLSQEVKERFGFESGMDPELLPPLATFNKDEVLK